MCFASLFPFVALDVAPYEEEDGGGDEKVDKQG